MTLRSGAHLAITLMPLAMALPLGHPHGTVHATKTAPLTDTEYWTYLVTSIVLVLVGGVFSGLTLGLMGQDEVHLQVVSQSGSSDERKNSKIVLKLLSKGKHWLLVTLLLSNVITNETLPVVLDRFLGGGAAAVFGSTLLIVIFGEIIPQSVCVRYGLQIGAYFAPYVQVLMYIMYPVAYPVAKLLDWSLGEEHGTLYGKSGLKTFVNLHHTMGADRLSQDEVTIINAVLDLKGKAVGEVMTPMEKVYTLPSDTILDENTVEEIFNAGFSRIPIHLPGEPTNFAGMLLVRILISYDPEDALPVSSFPLATLPETGYYTSCLNILNYFQEGKSHMVVVSDTPGMDVGAKGVVTLEDVIEELIGEEIVDESDVYVDVDRDIKRSIPGPLAKRNVVHYLHDLYNNGSHNESENASLVSSPRSPGPTESVKSRSSDRAPSVGSGSYIRKEDFVESRAHRLAQRHAEGQPPPLGPSHSSQKVPHIQPKQEPADIAHELAAASAAAGGIPQATTKMKPQNPASNPLHTNNEHITIKKQPSLETGKGSAAAPAAPGGAVAAPAPAAAAPAGGATSNAYRSVSSGPKADYGASEESSPKVNATQSEGLVSPHLGGIYDSEVSAFVKGVKDNVQRGKKSGKVISGKPATLVKVTQKKAYPNDAANKTVENILDGDIEAARVDPAKRVADAEAARKAKDKKIREQQQNKKGRGSSRFHKPKKTIAEERAKLEDKVLPKSPFAEDAKNDLPAEVSHAHHGGSPSVASSNSGAGIVENNIVTDSGFTKTVIEESGASDSD